jgi:hypothetical protein
VALLGRGSRTRGIARNAGYKTGIGQMQRLKNSHLCAGLLQTKGLKPDDVLRAPMGWPGISLYPPRSPAFFWAFMVASRLLMLYFFQVLGVSIPQNKFTKPNFYQQPAEKHYADAAFFIPLYLSLNYLRLRLNP